PLAALSRKQTTLDCEMHTEYTGRRFAICRSRHLRIVRLGVDADWKPVLDIPYDKLTILAAGSKYSTVRAPSQCRNGIFVLGQIHEDGAGLALPQKDSACAVRRGEESAIRTKRKGSHPVGMFLDC